MQSSNRTMMDEALEVLKEGRELLHQIDDQIFSRNLSPLFNSSIGSHIRHCLDFYLCFLQGFDARRIDYDNRERDKRIATDRQAAMAKIDALIDQLRGLSFDCDSITLLVCLEDDSLQPSFSASTIARELQFLKSHTIHHYSLIAVMLRLQGIEPNEEFGVSTSTLQNRSAA